MSDVPSGHRDDAHARTSDGAAAAHDTAGRDAIASAPFEVIDALGWCRLHRRAADLDGSVPLRAARACLPLLEGNAYGWQISTTRPIAIRRRVGRWQLVDDDLVRSARGCVPYLAAHGLLRGQWAQLFAEGPLAAGRAFDGRLGWWTGLLVRASATALRISHGGNRRNRDIGVGEAFVPTGGEWIPLVLELVAPAGGASFVLGNEIATLSPVASLPVVTTDLTTRADLGLAHLQFFDAAYFDDKRRGPTKKYRQLVASQTPATELASLVVAQAGPSAISVETRGRRHDEDGPRTADTVARIVVQNLVGFTAHEDGSTVAIDADSKALGRVAAEIDATWSAVYGREVLAGSKGALWYLTKYFTPHVTGEPHFFVKPPALFATPRSHALVVDGIHGPGYDVMRGVVRSDRFHAVPAVFSVDRGATIEVAARTPLCRLLAFDPVVDRALPHWHAPLPTAAS